MVTSLLIRLMYIFRGRFTTLVDFKILYVEVDFIGVFHHPAPAHSHAQKLVSCPDPTQLRGGERVCPEAWSSHPAQVRTITPMVPLKTCYEIHYPTLSNLKFYTNNYKASTLPQAQGCRLVTPAPFCVRLRLGCMRNQIL